MDSESCVLRSKERLEKARQEVKSMDVDDRVSHNARKSIEAKKAWNRVWLHTLCVFDVGVVSV